MADRDVERSLSAVSRIPDLVSHHRIAGYRHGCLWSSPMAGQAAPMTMSMPSRISPPSMAGRSSTTTSSATATRPACRKRARISGRSHLFLDELDALLHHLGIQRPLRLSRPVLGRHARRRTCGATAERPEGAGHRQFAGQHAHLGFGGQSPAAELAAGRPGHAAQA